MALADRANVEPRRGDDEVIDVVALEDDIARSQNGHLTWAQLLQAGLTRAQVRGRVARGQLYRRYRGVYAVTHPDLLPNAAEAAALLAVGPRAVLSHRSAAAKWSLAKRDPREVDVTLTGTDVRPRQGIRIHHVRRLDARDITIEDNLKLTAPARTIIDFATDASIPEIEHALAEARAQRLITDAKLEPVLARTPINHRGAARLRAILGKSQTARVLTRSERERKLLKLLEAAGLPKPLVNQRLHGYVPDFYWPEHGLILEFDGFTTHGSRAKFESDRRRDQTYAAHGIQTIRATWLQLEREPVALVVRIGQALATRTTPGNTTRNRKAI